MNTLDYNKDSLFTEGVKLLTQWQSGNEDASKKLKTLFDAVIIGKYDSCFGENVPEKRVNIRTSLHMTTLTLLNKLYGINSKDFYKGDPKRYVRTTLMTQLMLGIRKLTLHWPVYAFGAESIGQNITYPDHYAPSVSVGEPLIDRSNWKNLDSPDLDNDIIKVMEEMISCFIDLTNEVPIVHLPAPYSLVADIFGQEGLIMALIEEPEFIQTLLIHITRHIFVPWCNHFSKIFPNLLIEFSDASGSPDFIGPELFKNTAALPILHLINNYSWGNRIFVSNYRGDAYPKNPDKNNTEGIPNSLAEIIDFKLKVCPFFIIKLEADKEPVSYYIKQALRRNIPLHLGIGAIRIDRNNNLDHEISKKELKDLVVSYTLAIILVSKEISQNFNNYFKGYGDIYIEDINAESDFTFVKTIIDSVASVSVS
jgi:hypothetical protein